MECEECGWEMEESETECPNCGNSLLKNVEKDEKTYEINENKEMKKNSLQNEINGKIIARCNISHFETEIQEGENKFYCEDCDEWHTIDNEVYVAERVTEEIETESEIEEEKETVTEIESRKEDGASVLRLVLKDNESEFIEIPKKGGIIGRSGDYGSKFFNDRYLLTISREHFRIKFEDGEWIICRLSRNDTEINGENLELGASRIIRNNDKLRLARTISFIVRIES